MNGSIGRRVVLICLGFLSAHAFAQDLTPRAYVITPIGTNALVLAYSHLEGGLQFAGSVPITGATADISLPVISYYHSLDFFSRSANFSIAAPFGAGTFEGTVKEAPKSAYRTGFLDLYARFAVNLIGGPAMQPSEFMKWRQDVLLGFSLTINAPTGQYDPTLLINWGNNRWGVKPELGYSQRWGHWLLDGYLGGWFFTKNPEFFSHNMYFPGVNTEYEHPVGAVETHLSYDFKPRLWVSLDANYWWGGATDVNGIENGQTNQKNSRIGITASFPLTAHQSIKMSFSDGAYISYGGNYRDVSLGWQYGWIGWP